VKDSREQFRFSTRSKAILSNVHQELVIVMTTALALSPVDFVVIEGVRTPERQRKLVETGASWTMDSRHIPLAHTRTEKRGASASTHWEWLSRAVDVAALVDVSPGRKAITWDWRYYQQIAGAVKTASVLHGIPIVWGGDWEYRDGPHFELNRQVYP
jgi:peptidoglycan L-alanyl-D-glutamate endopeptidase CwlK